MSMSESESMSEPKSMPIYAVKKGVVPGIYRTWEEAEKQVKGYPGAQFRKFKPEELQSAQAYASIKIKAKLRIKPVIIKKSQPLKPRTLTSSEQEYFNHKDYRVPSEKGELHIYTDGSTIGNGLRSATGGYGVFFGHMEIPYITQTLKAAKVTNNVAELKAIIEALKVVQSLGFTSYIIHYDSDYAAGVITGRKNAHKNLELVQEGKNALRAVKDQGKLVTFNHVYSHTGKKDLHSIGNDIVDTLAKCKPLA